MLVILTGTNNSMLTSATISATSDPTISPTFKPTPSPTTRLTPAPTLSYKPSRAPTTAPTETPCPISVAELNGLEFLYNYTNGQNWTWQGSMGIWSFPATTSDPYEYNWQGLTFIPKLNGSSGCEVNRIHLQRYSLSGRIPGEISMFSNLQELNLYVNRLTGMIPNEIFTLSNLTKL